MRNNSFVKRIFGGYFKKTVLPYWAVLFADATIVFLASLFTYWIAHPSFIITGGRLSVFCTALLYALLSWVGACFFKTYRGVLRYSSSADLVKLGYAGLTSLVLAVGLSLVSHHFGISLFTAFSPLHTVVVFVISIMLLWSMRIGVRSIFESINASVHTNRVLIYGALSGGLGMAKNIRSQSQGQYELCGFISHEKRIRGMRLLGLPVYTPDDDLATIVKDENIHAVLISPYRVEDFRNDQEVQNILIEAGCKILMAQHAKEIVIKDGELSDEEMMHMQIKEVSVEDLLPRQEIRVDLKSVEALLKGRRVLITGSAGSIGMEIVRQVAQFNPEKMILIDQAETPQHDVRLMMGKQFPDVPCEVVVTSISRHTRMEHIFNEFRPDYVFHAAAYKHVPMMEDNPSEAVMNNIYGTKVIADLSVKYGVKKFVMISTDKAVNPTNVS